MQVMQNQTIVVLGASNKPHRYSNKAIRMLQEYGYHVIPVHPKLENIEGLVVKHKLENIVQPVDTLAMYLGAERSKDLIGSIINLNPARVIFNPGSESELLEHELYKNGISFVKDCTLLMLEHGRF